MVRPAMRLVLDEGVGEYPLSKLLNKKLKKYPNYLSTSLSELLLFV